MESPFDYRLLFESPIVRLAYIGWRGRRGALSGEATYPWAEITFQRRGMFFKTHGPRRVACDPNTLLFIKADEPYRLAHPIDLDCSCTALYLTRSMVEQILRQVGGATAEASQGIFGFDDAPNNPEFTLRHYEMLAALDAVGSNDPLAIEERGLSLATATIESAVRFHRHRVRPVRPATQRANRDTVRSVKELLVLHWNQRISLSEIAAAVHCAPTHLCKLFKADAGVSIHRYLTRLRLARAVEFLTDTQIDLATLAVRLGFVHHSHFTYHFRREFGFPPSTLRTARHAFRPREIAKIMTA